MGAPEPRAPGWRPPAERGAYDHRIHAGNVGDVLKHVACVEVARRLGPARIIDAHAGSGGARLAPTGEWQEGVARVPVAPGAPRAVRAWLAARTRASAGAPEPWYPGSSAFLAHAATGAQVAAFEADEEAAARLRRNVERFGVQVTQGDGWAAAGAASPGDLVVIDPPYDGPADWDRAGRCAGRAATCATLVWYPIKALSRPNRLLEVWRDAGVPFAAVELITYPIEERRNRLNGSGVVLGGAASIVAPAVIEAAAWLGPRLALRDGLWSMRTTARAAAEPTRTP